MKEKTKCKFFYIFFISLLILSKKVLVNQKFFIWCFKWLKLLFLTHNVIQTKIYKIPYFAKHGWKVNIVFCDPDISYRDVMERSNLFASTIDSWHLFDTFHTFLLTNILLAIV